MVSIQKASSVPHYLKLLVYGPPAVGKTTLAGTAEDHEDMAPVLLCNIEGGELSVKNRLDVWTTDQLRDVKSVEEVFWHIAQGDDGWNQYKTIVIVAG